jgi:DNA-binding ferritin-like protein
MNDTEKTLIEETKQCSMKYLKEVRNKLIEYRKDMEKRMNIIQKQIDNCTHDIQSECGKGGHKLIWEIEQGPYGERYQYCTECQWGL